MKLVPLQITPDDAENVKDGWQYARQRDFRGGENLSDLPETVGRNQLIRMENAIIGPKGLLTDSWQTDQAVMTHADAILGLVLGEPDGDGVYPYWLSGTTPADKIISGEFDPTLAVVDISLGMETTPTGFGGGGQPAHAAMAGLAFAVPYLRKNYYPNSAGGVLNLTDSAVIYNGALAGKTVVKLRQYDNRLWGVTATGELIFSNNGDATTWDANNIILLPNQEKLLDFLPVQGGVILYSRTSVYKMYGSGTYQDTSVLLIRDNLLLSEDGIMVADSVYIASNRGMVKVGLNGFEEPPHNQDEFFASNYAVWANQTANIAVRPIYLHRFKAILFTVFRTLGSQSWLYYPNSNAYAKLSYTMTGLNPLALPDPHMDFLVMADPDIVGEDEAVKTVCRSTYPSAVLAADRITVIQTRHEDADSLREKIWRHLSIVAAIPAYNVTLEVFLDYSETPTTILFATLDLFAGDNIIDLFDLDGEYLRSKAISFRLTFDAFAGGAAIVTSDETGEVVTGYDDTPLISDTPLSYPAAFAIRELRIKYCETGAEN